MSWPQWEDCGKGPFSVVAGRVLSWLWEGAFLGQNLVLAWHRVLTFQAYNIKVGADRAAYAVKYGQLLLQNCGAFSRAIRPLQQLRPIAWNMLCWSTFAVSLFSCSSSCAIEVFGLF